MCDSQVIETAMPSIIIHCNLSAHHGLAKLKVSLEHFCIMS